MFKGYLKFDPKTGDYEKVSEIDLQSVDGIMFIDLSQLEFAIPPDSEDDPSPEEKSEGERLKEFFFGKPKAESDWAKQLREQGRCPKCGRDGRIHLSTFVCDEHGPF